MRTENKDQGMWTGNKDQGMRTENKDQGMWTGNRPVGVHQTQAYNNLAL